MILFSNTLCDFFKTGTVRVNLAWQQSFEGIDGDIFLDYPKDRKKPPFCNLNLENIVDLCNSNPNIKYLAVSNVNIREDIEVVLNLCKFAQIVPKIETIKAVANLHDILDLLQVYLNPMIMLDHDDLYADCCVNNVNSQYEQYKQKIIEICKDRKVMVLKTLGVVFAA